MRKEKLIVIMFFCSLVAENDWVLAYYNDMWTPARLLEWFTERLPIKISYFELACLLMFVVCRRKGAVARPMIRAMQVSVASLTFSVLYGLSRGGEMKPILTQIIAWLACIVFTLAAVAALSTAEDLHRLNSAIAYAALWRACIAIIYYLKVRGRDWRTMPAHMTTHEDTVLFVVGLLILVSRAIELRTKRDIRLLAAGAPLILLAIQVNNRRLAWASLVAGLLVLYSMLPSKSKTTRKLNQTLRRAAPILALYVVVGWGRPEKIFKPLQSFSSMGMAGGQVDNSTRARDNENISLVTMIQERPILGTGLGLEWIELDSRFTVPTSTFPLYHYLPHNSAFALMAFCGGLGLAGLWMVIPISVFMNARTYRKSQNPLERSVAVVGIVQVVAYLNQAYGDMAAMGATHVMPSTILGVAFVAATRLSVSSGAWPSSSSTRLQKSSPKPARA